MFRLFIIGFAFFLWTSEASKAQTLTITGSGTMPISEQDTLDYTQLYVLYKQTVQTDSTNAEKRETSEMALQIGRKISKYSNRKRLLSDSINRVHAIDGKIDMQEIQNHLARMKGAGDLSETFKNHPSAGKILYREGFINGPLFYEEEIPKFGWEIAATETLNILGYSCAKATVSFRGRVYTAWFAADVAVNNGPWKFEGLPGLILKIEDSKKQFCFEAIAIYPVSWKQPITYNIRKKEIKTTREKFNIAKKRAEEEAITLLKNSGRIPSDTNLGTGKKRLYTPIELF